MTEKEFIVKFIDYLDNEKWKGIIPNYDAVEEWLDEWLKEFHKEYYEVEFIRRDHYNDIEETYGEETLSREDKNFYLEKDNK